jgi:hypothetical protein
VDYQGWEAVCRDSGAVPMERVHTKHGTIFIAEGRHEPKVKARNPSCRKTHFVCIWAHERGSMKIAKHLYLAAMDHLTWKSRRAVVLADVHQYLQDRYGRYQAGPRLQ